MRSATAEPEVRARERAWQNATGWSFQEEAHGRPGTSLVLERQFARIAEALELSPGLRVLDLGCGTGHLLHWLGAHHRARWTGMDLSFRTLCVARSRDPEAAYAAGDAERLPFADGSFERIVCNGSAHHFLDLGAAMREVRRILAPGGVLVLHEPVAALVPDFVRRTLFRNSRYESPADLAHKHEFTRASVEHTLADLGFVGIAGCFHDFLAYPLSGMYLELPWSRSQRIMSGLSRIESGISRLAALRPLLDRCSWRLLLRASLPAV